jgi:hypothetical protein
MSLSQSSRSFALRANAGFSWWPTNPLERLNGEIKRRTDVMAIFPNEAAIVRLVGALLLEQNDEWAVQRRYMSLETLEALSDDPQARHHHQGHDPAYTRESHRVVVPGRDYRTDLTVTQDIARADDMALHRVIHDQGSLRRNRLGSILSKVCAAEGGGRRRAAAPSEASTTLWSSS